MFQKKKLAIALDTTLGWRSVDRNWRRLFPHHFSVEAHWIDLALLGESKKPGRKTKLRQVIRRLQMTNDINHAVRAANADAALIGNMALNLLVRNADMPLFTMVDATQHQLHQFGDAYGIYPSKIRSLENLKHRIRCRAYQDCAGIFSFSRWAASSLVENYGVDANKVHIVPPGADLQRWIPQSRAGRNSKTCHILFVGGDFERKGGAMLLEWASRTNEINWHLHIVTKSSLATENPRVSVYNHIFHEDAELTDLFALADVFVLPTLYDCSSLAIQEALAAGLPVITTNVGGLPELVIEGVTGYTVPVLNHDSFVDRLELMISDSVLRSRMHDAAVQDARARFDAKANIIKILEVIANVA